MTVVHIYESAPVRHRLTARRRQWAREDALSGRVTHRKRRTHDDITPHIILVVAAFLTILWHFSH